jgi:transposase
LEQEVSQALEAPYQEVAEAVSKAPVKNLDETGWKQCGKRRWLWTAATRFLAIFVIHARRGEEGLLAVLKDRLLGIFNTDRWSAYKVRAKRYRQICWAHLRRDFQKLIDRGDRGAKVGRRAKEIANWLFAAWRDFKAGAIDRETLQQCLRPVRREFKKLLKQGARLKGTKASVVCQNLLELEPALWTFTRVDGVEPTNNHAERVLRKGVIWRKISFGTRSDGGARFVERILTAVQSLRLQKRPVLDFMFRAVEAHRNHTPSPSLLPSR